MRRVFWAVGLVVILGACGGESRRNPEQGADGWTRWSADWLSDMNTRVETFIINGEPRDCIIWVSGDSDGVTCP